MKNKNPITICEFIAEYGAPKLARACGVDRSVPWKWARGISAPTLEHAEIILKLAKGRLKLADLRRRGGAQ